MLDVTYVVAPKEGMGDDQIRFLEWTAAEGTRVNRGDVIGLAETTKAAFEVVAEGEGFLFHLVAPGDRVDVGAPLAALASRNERPVVETSTKAVETVPPANVTRKALELLQAHGLSPSLFAGLDVVRSDDVEEYIRTHGTRGSSPAARFFGSEELTADRNWDEMLTASDVVQLQAALTGLRRRLKARFNRHVPVGTLVHDRWDVAREYGFGEQTSVYDECLILGDVKVGSHCWVGPFTVLDGNFASLRIGDYTSIGSGTHIYTHHAINNVISKGQLPTFTADTVIGAACFISPMVVVGPGSRIGDHSFVASGSYVQGEFPAYSYLAGTPARSVGRVEIKHNHVLLIRDEAAG